MKVVRIIDVGRSGPAHARGRLTFHAEVRQENASMLANSTGCGIVRGKNAAIRYVPTAMTIAT